MASRRLENELAAVSRPPSPIGSGVVGKLSLLTLASGTGNSIRVFETG